MTEREAIESTYFDKAVVTRRISVKDDVIKQTKQQEILIISNLPCALSRDKSGNAFFGDGYGKTSSTYTLFYSPDAEILSGDKLFIVTASGQNFTLWAGKPFVYTSHCEVPLSIEDERA